MITMSVWLVTLLPWVQVRGSGTIADTEMSLSNAIVAVTAMLSLDCLLTRNRLLLVI